MITVFDIETHPLSEEHCLKFLPDKIGNTTDPEKVKIKFLETLALHAKTAYIACIGYKDSLGSYIYDNKVYTEPELIEGFYQNFKGLGHANLMVGHNCFNFDLPFIVQRGFFYGIKPPDGLRKGRYWNESIKDTVDLWTCGVYGSYIHLKDLARFFDVGDKTGNGADFPNLWDTDPDKAIEYLKNDLEITYKIATKLL